jgi:fumarate reductase subunit D
MQNKEIQEGKFFAVISYISFLCIVSLVLKKENKFAVYHAKQGLVLFVFETASFILSVLPLLGVIVKTLGLLAFTLASVWGILQSLTGKYCKIPIVSAIADKITI